MINISAVVAVNNYDVFEHNFLQSPPVRYREIDVYVKENPTSMSICYNEGINSLNSRYLLFAHQDVYIPANSYLNIKNSIHYMEKIDPRWAVIGIIGISIDGSIVGSTWDSGIAAVVGTPNKEPIIVQSLDELLIILNWKNLLFFDEKLPDFHLYGTDIVQLAKKRGYNSYVINAPVIHNSLPVLHLNRGYVNAYKYMQKKWKTILPLQTLVLPVSRYGFFLKKRLIMQSILYFNKKRSDYHRLKFPSIKASELGYE